MSQNLPGQQPRPLALLSEAAAELAHDLNNALTVVLGNLSMATADSSIPPQLRDKLTASQLAGLRAQALCQQLQNFAVAAAPQPEAFSLETLIQEVLEVVRPSGFFKNEIVSGPAVPPALLDISKFGVALEGVLTFLHKLAPPESPFTFQIGTTKTPGDPLPVGNYLDLTISTAAPAFPPDQLPEVFSCKFRKANKEAGFSLAAAYALISAQGGDIHALPGTTAAVRIVIPASGSEAASEAGAPLQSQSPAPLSPEPAKTGSLHVLVLDDEPMLCELLTCALENFGHQVTTTNEGAEALTSYEQAFAAGKPFDLVFCDLSLPDIDGAEVCSRIRALDPKARVIVCSGVSRNPVVEQYREHGFCAVLPKPYEFERIPAFLAKAMSSPLP